MSEIQRKSFYLVLARSRLSSSAFPVRQAPQIFTSIVEETSCVQVLEESPFNLDTIPIARKTNALSVPSISSPYILLFFIPDGTVAGVLYCFTPSTSAPHDRTFLIERDAWVVHLHTLSIHKPASTQTRQDRVESCLNQMKALVHHRWGLPAGATLDYSHELGLADTPCCLKHGVLLSGAPVWPAINASIVLCMCFDRPYPALCRLRSINARLGYGNTVRKGKQGTQDRGLLVRNRLFCGSRLWVAHDSEQQIEARLPLDHLNEESESHALQCLISSFRSRLLTVEW